MNKEKSFSRRRAILVAAVLSENSILRDPDQVLGTHTGLRKRSFPIKS